MKSQPARCGKTAKKKRVTWRDRPRPSLRVTLDMVTKGGARWQSWCTADADKHAPQVHIQRAARDLSVAFGTRIVSAACLRGFAESERAMKKAKLRAKKRSKS